MPFTLVGFNESQAAATLIPFGTLSDEHITQVLDDLTVPALNQILMVFAQKTAITRCQLQSPSLRRIFNLDIAPLNIGLVILATDTPIAKFIENPIPLVVSEKLNAFILGDATADNGTVLVWLSDGTPVPASGEIRTIRGTIPTTTTTFAWTNQTITFGQTLPAGRYAIVGARVVAANGIAYRFIFKGGTWRPGGLCGILEGTITPDIFRNGKLGVWGEFEFDQPPSVEILCSAATGSAVVYLDLIQVREGR